MFKRGLLMKPMMANELDACTLIRPEIVENCGKEISIRTDIYLLF